MKRYFLLILMVFLLMSPGVSAAEKYESISLINNTDWVTYFDDLLGDPYDSHGCLHFTPSDIYLLVKTIPNGIPLRIKNYYLKKNDPPFPVQKVPYFSSLIKAPEDVNKHAAAFKARKTEIVVYPSLNRLFIMIDDAPYAQVKAKAGPPYDFLMAFAVIQGRPIEWDAMLSTPTDPGDYTILRSTDHYISSTYYNNTIVPFGAWIMQKQGVWSYQKGDKWYKLPQHIIYDINFPADQREYNYYDISQDASGKVVAARFAGHDFGKYVLLWTKDGKNHYPEMGYAAGELLYEQIVLIKDLVHITTLPGPDDFDYCVSKNENFRFYKDLYEFVESKGKTSSSKVAPQLLSYYKLYNGISLTVKDQELIDPRVEKSFKEYKENRLPRNQLARQQALGLYYYLQLNDTLIRKYAHWYEKVKKDWQLWKFLREKSRQDFEEMGILSVENRQNVMEEWLSNRLEFKIAELPLQAKYLTDLSFSTFFKPDEKAFLFNQRERDIMYKLIKEAGTEEAKGINFYSVKALNDYNFGLLLNEILGDLYKSHGCMHLSPRNIQFLFELLPVGTKLVVHDYSAKADQKTIDTVPYLAHLVNFKDDLDKLKGTFVTGEVEVAVYPLSGYWIINIKDKPFAKVEVKGGPQAKMYLVQGRDKDGKPIFEEHLAYPTSTGNFKVFRKVKDYVSNIYHDQTVVPMGGEIKKEDGAWVYQNKKGEWVKIPKVLQGDLSHPPEEREYTYYDPVSNASGEVESVRWGSHPFGTYSIQTTKDDRTPFPELIHSSGDLMMEERQLINDLIKVLSAPHDELDACINYSQNFELYKTCYDFVKDPYREDLIQVKERASYKLYFGLSLTSLEVQSLPEDVIIADKIIRKQKLSEDEIRTLINEGIAYRRSGNLKINMEKVLGLQFDTYQYVVTIQKYAHHYETLQKHWKELTDLRRALLKDFNNFVIKDPLLLHNFTRELMLERTRLEKLNQQKALEILREML
ncbi:MAG: L,D-transpeptidase [Candidatus Margulisbacteria bacterium]|nr:L,D-transpeptidase [Candidatus Margulisiibacteriota bacterium]MBU1022137.1 L,D-transpeptidase [Candidatus Margulisiibacteriota bacterium]MBU1729424.1 L,D-transpeptidase [Candidatus Margulisiibacteriota bacterium]MBU1955697.1 L,D-transpeptidase [Candidatus Margulisiibacteriota bacterium]